MTTLKDIFLVSTFVTGICTVATGLVALDCEFMATSVDYKARIEAENKALGFDGNRDYREDAARWDRQRVRAANAFPAVKKAFEYSAALLLLSAGALLASEKKKKRQELKA